jgi:hypothetical protein
MPVAEAAVTVAMTAEPPRWQAATEALEHALDVAMDESAGRLRRGSRLALVLPSAHARYALLPWNPALTGVPAADAAWLQACFEDIHGPRARDWVCLGAAPRWGRPTLACAVDRLLLERLDALAAARGLRLTQVQPALVHAWNAVRATLAAGPLWCVLAEAGGLTNLTLLRLEAGAALHLKSLPGRWTGTTAAATQALIRAAVLREERALGLPPGFDPVLVVSPAPTAPGAVGWQALKLTPDVAAAAPAPTSTHAGRRAQPLVA